MQWILILNKCWLEFFQPYVFHAELAYHNFSTLFLIMVSLYTEQVFFVGFFFPKEQSTWLIYYYLHETFDFTVSKFILILCLTNHLNLVDLFLERMQLMLHDTLNWNKQDVYRKLVVSSVSQVCCNSLKMSLDLWIGKVWLRSSASAGKRLSHQESKLSRSERNSALSTTI